MYRSILPLPRTLSRHTKCTRILACAPSSSRNLSTTAAHRSRTPFSSGPSPPRLPKEEQEIFERLQRQSTGAFSTPRRPESEDVDSSTASTSSASSPTDIRARINQVNQAPSETTKDDEELHPNIRRGAPPEFEGDTNPKTGEVGGPKNEPLRWGTQGDWSFNGRVTDF